MLMLIKVINTYHGTYEIVKAKSLKEAMKNYASTLEETAENLAPHEIDSEWENYYKTYDEALNASFEGIMEQLNSELEFEIVKK